MCKSTFYLAIILFSAIFYVTAYRDYYWRDYNGTIPEDAIIGGQDHEGKNVYIGQVYISREGLVPVQINQDTAIVYAEIKGVQSTRKNIKILCGPPENMKWIETSSSTLHMDLINKHPVLGGHEDGWGTYFVGRITSGDRTCIGKVLESGMNGLSFFYCVNEARKSEVSNVYDILINTNNKDKY